MDVERCTFLEGPVRNSTSLHGSNFSVLVHYLQYHIRFRAFLWGCSLIRFKFVSGRMRRIKPAIKQLPSVGTLHVYGYVAFLKSFCYLSYLWLFCLFEVIIFVPSCLCLCSKTFFSIGKIKKRRRYEICDRLIHIG